MHLTIDRRSNGFRIRWPGGRHLCRTEVELKEWLVRFDFGAGRAVSADEQAARSFATRQEDA